MKVKKKTALLASFTVGTLLFATTALADITSKSGYEQLKDGLKVAADKMSGEFDSFTLDYSFVVKDNGKVLQSENGIQKKNRNNKATESMSIREGSLSPISSSYFYSDNKTDIRRGNDETYYVLEFSEDRELHQFKNPFEEDEAEDVERIVDAVVGSLKDHVIVKDNPDGNKELNGSLTEMQIPTIVNAVSSFQLKQEFNSRNGMQSELPRLTQDTFVKEVSGSAVINKEGVLEKILGAATISGKDSTGLVHDITVEVLVQLKDVNATMVKKPELTGKKVIKEVGEPTRGSELTNPKKFIGKFKNDIIVDQNGKFVKAGERLLEITQINSSTVTGRYHEEVKSDFKGTIKENEEFTFSGTFDNKDFRTARLEISSENGGKMEGFLFLDEYVGKIQFNLNRYFNGNGPLMYDSLFSPVLE